MVAGRNRQKSLNAIIKQCKKCSGGGGGGGFQSGYIRQKSLNRHGHMGKLDCIAFSLCMFITIANILNNFSE